MGTAKGWIAIGDRAYGILFAAGGVAVGCISMGGAAIGVIAIGGAAVGLLAFGGFALGDLAIGGGAIGILAAGGVATAWIGAEGGLAVARQFAQADWRWRTTRTMQWRASFLRSIRGWI